MSGPIASAVVLPEPDEAAPAPPPPPPPVSAASPTNTLKRRQSSVTEDSVKRPRTNGDDAEDPSTAAAVPKRRERGRERRLFGAVLGALSQNPTTAGQKRRSEIEKKQMAQRRQENEESEQRKAERLARRKVQRWKEQKRFERQTMKARHDNMLHLAHFLYTKSEPQLYYKPWEMSPDEEDRITDQVAEAKETIQRERDEFEAREEEERQRERRATPDEWTYRGTDLRTGDGAHDRRPAQRGIESEEATNGRQSQTQDQEMQDQPAGDIAPEPQPTDGPAVPQKSPEHEVNADEPSKDADEEVVEAAEDTVIY